MNKTNIIVSILMIYLLTPVGAMMFSVPGYQRIGDEEIIKRITTRNYNIITGAGIKDFLTDMFALSRYTFSDVPAIFIIIYGMFGFILIILFVLSILPGGSS